MVRMDITVVKGSLFRLRLARPNAPHSFSYSIGGSGAIITEGITEENYGIHLNPSLTASLPEGSGSYEVYSTDASDPMVYGELRVVNSIAQSFQNTKIVSTDPRD